MIKNVFLKELKDIFRDKKSIMTSTIASSIFLIMLIIIGGRSEVSFDNVEKIIVGVNIGSESKFVEELKGYEDIVIKNVENYQEAIEKGEIDIYMEVPNNFQDKINNKVSTEINLYYDTSQDISILASKKLKDAVKNYEEEIIYNESASENVDSINLNISSIESNSDEDMIGTYVSNLIFIFSIGVFFMVADVGVGEKERKSIEPLLATKVRRKDIVIGKVLATSVVSVIPITVNLIIFYILTSNLDREILNVTNMNLNGMVIGVLFLMGICSALLFSSIGLCISAYSKSYKSAQITLNTCLMGIFVFSSQLNAVRVDEVALKEILTPALNIMIIGKQVLMGVYDTSLIGITVIATLVVSFVLMEVGKKIYNNDNILQ